MRTLSLSLLLISTLFLAGCSLDESTPVGKKKTANTLALDKLETENKSQAPATPPQAPPQQPPTNPTPKTMAKQYPSAPALQIDTKKTYTATLHTDKGDIVIDLAAKATPITVNNFVFLAKEHFYDNVTFHRVINNFMIQGGDPTGTGMGGPGYKFNDEPFTGEYKRGTVAMANAGQNTNGSQFFIMHADNALPKNYVIFGTVTTGMEAVDAIATAPNKPSGQGDSPATPVVIMTIDITEK